MLGIWLPFFFVFVPGLGSGGPHGPDGTIAGGSLGLRAQAHRLAAREGRGAARVELPEVDADLAVVGLFEGEELPAELAAAPGAADAKGAFKKLALLHPERPGRVLVVGLGKREEMDAERARVAAALAAQRGRRGSRRARSPGRCPSRGDDAATAEALVTGTILGSYRFDRFLSRDARRRLPRPRSSR